MATEHTPHPFAALLGRVATIIGHDLSREESSSFSAFVGRGSGVTHWNDARLRGCVEEWIKARTPITLTPPSEIPSEISSTTEKGGKKKKEPKSAEPKEGKKAPSERSSSRWSLFLKHLAEILPSTVNGTKRMSFGSFLRKIKSEDKWTDAEILLEFSTWVPPVKKDGASVSSNEDEDPMAPATVAPPVPVPVAVPVAVIEELVDTRSGEPVDPLVRAQALLSSIQSELADTERQIIALNLRRQELSLRIEEVTREVAEIIAEKEKEKKEKEASKEPEKEKEKEKEVPLSQRRKKMPKHIKTLVWSQHIGSDKASAPCCSCRKEIISIRSFHCGHVIAEAKGGDLTIANLRPICAACNGSMGTRSMNEFTKEYFGWMV
jgi:hypothetical protein